MALLILSVKTDVVWIDATAKVPILGHIFLFGLMFIPPVLASFLVREIIPSLHSDIGFTKAMFILLPGWNLSLWFMNIRLYLFFLPAWAILGVIAFVKGILLIAGIDDRK